MTKEKVYSPPPPVADGRRDSSGGGVDATSVPKKRSRSLVSLRTKSLKRSTGKLRLNQKDSNSNYSKDGKEKIGGGDDIIINYSNNSGLQMPSDDPYDETVDWITNKFSISDGGGGSGGGGGDRGVGVGGDSVKKWLIKYRFRKYVPLFQYHKVSIDLLPLLTLDELKEMGIYEIGDRKRIYSRIMQDFDRK